jgi:hypothetical protein
MELAAQRLQQRSGGNVPHLVSRRQAALSAVQTAGALVLLTRSALLMANHDSLLWPVAPLAGLRLMETEQAETVWIENRDRMGELFLRHDVRDDGEGT